MTNKIELRTTQQVLNDYTPSYSPLMPYFLQRNAVKHDVEVGKVEFKRSTTVGDIRARKLTPKDTEMHQIASGKYSKNFVKYVLGAQYIESQLQNREGFEAVEAEVLDEHNKQSDSLFLLGGSGNNGLLSSSDPNYVLKSSAEIPKATDGTHYAGLHAKIISLLQDMSSVDGEKLILVYGAVSVEKFNGVYPSNNTPFAKTLRDALEDFNASVQKLPSQITPNGQDGFVIINLDKITTHYMLLPTLFSQGINDEKMYGWANFLMGSSTIDVRVAGAITKQPLTYQA